MLSIIDNGFEMHTLLPVGVLLLISCIVPVILAALKLKTVPVFVLEIIIGMILGSFAFAKDIFTNDLSEGLYTIGMIFLLLLSGIDTDFSIVKKVDLKDDVNINSLKISWLLIIAVYAFSFLVALCFLPMYETGDEVKSVILITILLSSTFASVVIPVVHQKLQYKTTLGQILCSYSSIAELLSIISISIYMIVTQTIHHGNPLFIILLAVLLLLTYLIGKIGDTKIFVKSMDGFIHLGLRLIILVLLATVLVAYSAGAEFILGAFLAGMILKISKISKHTIEKVEIIGYGLFIPMFFILIGVKMPIINIFENPRIIVEILAFFVMLIFAKLPLLYLLKWFKASTVIPVIFELSCTVIVAISIEHLHVFNSDVTTAMILASALTCLVPPIIYNSSKKFGVPRKKYASIILEEHEVENYEQ